MKSFIASLIGLALVASVVIVSAGPADNILGLVTPEIESLSAKQPVHSFEAPTANCLSHRMTSIKAPTKAYVDAEGVLNIEGHSTAGYAEDVLKERLFVVTPEIAKAAESAGVEIKCVTVTPTELTSLMRPGGENLAVK